MLLYCLYLIFLLIFTFCKILRQIILKHQILTEELLIETNRCCFNSKCAAYMMNLLLYYFDKHSCRLIISQIIETLSRHYIKVLIRAYNWTNNVFDKCKYLCFFGSDEIYFSRIWFHVTDTIWIMYCSLEQFFVLYFVYFGVRVLEVWARAVLGDTCFVLDCSERRLDSSTQIIQWNISLESGISMCTYNYTHKLNTNRTVIILPES